MKKLLMGAAALALFGASEVATAQTIVRQAPNHTTVVTTRPNGTRVVRRYSYGGRQFEAIRGPGWVAPRGWVTRRYVVNQFLPTYFLSSGYYVDPLRFGLRVRPAGYNRHWIRVGNDLYLVNNRGRIIEVVPSVFY